MDAVAINNTKVSVKIFKGQRVLTLNEIDKVHGRPMGTARKRFNDNKKHFIEGTDFYKLQMSENRTFGFSSPNGAIIITESGYLMLAKSFTDALAWKVQRALVSNYFRANEQSTTDTPKLETAEYHYFDKTYRGQPVLSVADLAFFTGINRSKIEWRMLKIGLHKGTDFYFLEAETLKAFKVENPNVSPSIASLYVITKNGFTKLMKFLGTNVETPKCFIAQKTDVAPHIPVDKPKTENVAINDYLVTLGVLCRIRDKLNSAGNIERTRDIDTAIKYTAWELSVSTTA